MAANNVFILDIEERTVQGSSACRRLRRDGKLPVVVYHDGVNAVSCEVPSNQFLNLAKKATPSHVFKMASKNPRLNGLLFLVKSVQKHPLNGTPLHADFYTLRGDQEVSVNVPVHVVGECKGVKAEGGILQLGIRTIKVKCLPEYIPEFVTVDVTDLHVGRRLTAGEIDLGDNVRLASESSDVVANVVPGRK